MVYSILAMETWPKLQSLLYVKANQPSGYLSSPVRVKSSLK